MRACFLLACLLAGTTAVALAAGAAAQVPESAVVATLPFEPREDPLEIVIDLSVPGARPFPLLLDTGAMVTVLSPKVARELGVPIRRLKPTPYRRATRLGRDLQFYVHTSSSDTAARMFEFGLLGGDFLEQYVVELDIPNRVVRLLDPKAYAVPEVAEPGWVLGPMQVIANRPAVDVVIEGVRVQALLDTGSPISLVVPGGVAARAGLASTPNHSLSLLTIVGPVLTELAVARRIGLLGVGFDDLPLLVAPRGLYNLGVSDGVVLGMDLLAPFTIRLDYPRGRIAMKRDPEVPLRFLGGPLDAVREHVELALAGEPAPGLAAEAPAVGMAGLPDVAARPRAAARDADAKIWLGLDAPKEGARERGAVAWTHLRGRAGLGTPVDYDVAVAIDLSGSTAYASGADVDGDGKVGKAKRRIDRWRSFNPRRMSSDAGDTILAAELLATRKLVESLAGSSTRLALVAFSDRARLQAPLDDDPSRLLEAVSRLEGRYGSGMTNLADALRVSGTALLAEGAPSPFRKPVVVVLSDGVPTFPGNERLAAKEAREAAAELREAGIEIVTLGLGLGELDEDDVYLEIARTTGGEHLRLEVPGDVVHALPAIELAAVPEIRIENVTVGAPGRAPRIAADGSFGAFVPLAPGRNLLRVDAVDGRGAETRVERWVHYEPAAATTPADLERAAREREAFERALSDRTVALQLALEANERRAALEDARQRKQVQIDGAAPVPAPAP